MDVSDIGLWQYGWRVALVLGLLFAAAVAVRRWGGALGRVSSARRNMHIVESLPVGPQRLLLVVEVEGRRLLIGATPQTFTLLTELESKENRGPKEERSS